MTDQKQADLKVPSVREMLSDIDRLLEKGDVETAFNMGKVASNQARISHALAMEALAKISIAKKDKDSAASFFKIALDILCEDDAGEKTIATHIKEQLSKLT